MAGRTNLDLDTLRTLAVAHDRGGLAQAAEHLGRTPSAISLQMKRLQEDLGITIFRKRGRGLALTEAGEIALSYARRILVLNDELLDTMQGRTSPAIYASDARKTLHGFCRRSCLTFLRSIRGCRSSFMLKGTLL